MDKEVQDKVWALLPKEFKDEVKSEYKNTTISGVRSNLVYLFGYYNLALKDSYEGAQEPNRNLSQETKAGHKPLSAALITLAKAAEAVSNLFEQLHQHDKDGRENDI